MILFLSRSRAAAAAEQSPVPERAGPWRVAKVVTALALVGVASYLTARLAWLPRDIEIDGAGIIEDHGKTANIDKTFLGYIGVGELLLLFAVVLLATATSREIASRSWDAGAVWAGGLLLALRALVIAAPDQLCYLAGLRDVYCFIFAERGDVLVVQAPVIALGIGLVACGVFARRLPWWLRVSLPIAAAVLIAAGVTWWFPLEGWS